MWGCPEAGAARSIPGSWEVGVMSKAERGTGGGQVAPASKSLQRLGFGHRRTPENGEAHLEIAKMKKVMIKCSFTGGRDEDNGWWPGGYHMHSANRINHVRYGTQQERQAQ